MREVIWQGRGGQGAFTAARLLGAAASLAEGRFALAFPSFGPERRGAPIRAFTKMDDAPIGDRSASAQADFVVYLDDTLLDEDWQRELKPGGSVLVNSARAYDDPRIVSVDADGLSSAVLGRPIPNTAFLGALAALDDRASLADVHEAVRLYMPEKLHAKNLVIIDAVYAQFDPARGGTAAEGDPACAGLVAGDPAGTAVAAEGDPAGAAVAAEGDLARAGVAGGPQDASGEGALPVGSYPAAKPRPVSRAAGVRIPTLRSGSLDPDYARTTCFEAGYLVAKNAGWRSLRPVIDATACTGCLQCYLYCPDGAIFKASAADMAAPLASSQAPATRAPRAATPAQAVFVDYDFCKGCGICVKACRFGALFLVSERQEQRETSEVAE